MNHTTYTHCHAATTVSPRPSGPSCWGSIQDYLQTRTIVMKGPGHCVTKTRHASHVMCGSQVRVPSPPSLSLPARSPPPPLCRVRSGEVGAAAFTVAGGGGGEPFSHFFEMSVGSGHMSLTLREDWRTHIRMAARDLGVKHIRGHGLLDDDMSVSCKAPRELKAAAGGRGVAVATHPWHADTVAARQLTVGARRHVRPRCVTDSNHRACVWCVWCVCVCVLHR